MVMSPMVLGNKNGCASESVRTHVNFDPLSWVTKSDVATSSSRDRNRNPIAADTSDTTIVGGLRRLGYLQAYAWVEKLPGGSCGDDVSQPCDVGPKVVPVSIIPSLRTV